MASAADGQRRRRSLLTRSAALAAESGIRGKFGTAMGAIHRLPPIEGDEREEVIWGAADLPQASTGRAPPEARDPAADRIRLATDGMMSAEEEIRRPEHMR